MTQICRTQSILDLIELGRQRRAELDAAEQARLQQEKLEAAQSRQASIDRLRAAVLAEVPEMLHPYIDWDALSIEYWDNSTSISIRIPECVPIAVGIDHRTGQWQWDGRYRISIPDHVEYGYQGDYEIHCEPHTETELPLALATAADAYPKLLELQAKIGTLEESRRVNQQQAEACATQYEKEDERQHEALLRILEADPVLRAIFHTAITYENARESWDAQLGSQYESMQALERRYQEDLSAQAGLDRTRRDAADANDRAREPAPSVIPSEARDHPPHTKPGLSPDDVANVRAQLARRRSGGS